MASGALSAGAASENREEKVMRGYCSIYTRLVVAAVLILALISSAKPLCAVEQMVLPLTFRTPQEGVAALMSACRENNTELLLKLFGTAGRNLVGTADRDHDRAQRLKFYGMAQERQKLEMESARKAILYVGKDNWPFPVPLVKNVERWHFDASAGENELANRVIGQNELQAIAACQAYVAAQKKYYTRDWNGNAIREYALHLWSSEGSRDGLYWPVDPQSGEELSPLGPLMAEAERCLEGKEGGEPFYGYFFRILTSQGPNARGGAATYVKDGRLTGGFALVAWPAHYGSTGIMTFLVNQAGEIYERDLGPTTGEVARILKDYNPDRTWRPVRLWLAGRKGH
jgi:hypothetical protein